MKKLLIFRKISVMTLFSLIIFAFTGCVSTNKFNKDNEIDINLIVNNYKMVATGQTKLYNTVGEEIEAVSEGDALYGQDGNYVKGAEMSYKKNGDGTVTDLNTGLIWQEIPLPEGLTYDDAVKYCEELELAGYSDWRVPSLKELYSISDFSSGWPYINTDYFTLATGKIDKSEQYWSSNRYVGTTVEGQDNSAFGVNYVTGHIKSYPAASSMENLPIPEEGSAINKKIDENAPNLGGEGALPPTGNRLAKHVRAVRGTAYGINDFKDNKDGTVTDKSTGLMWAQMDSGKGMDWGNALAYAENSELAGYTDWRLPNVKELQGIVDYSKSPSAIDSSKVGPAIDSIFRCTPIINEAGDADYGYYWTSTSANFTAGQPYYYAWYVAFGRAVDNNGDDFHGAGGVRFDTKIEEGPLGEGGERYYNYVRLVRDLK